ncbi:helix-turn-helix domain-containing protein [Seonamhaeicola marinus]|uniref:AraC family transcriptional regulator n=1 Tax=Seonamhaeicola marinus TaxID=1912246 RepID=A0A5D0JE79_9FLAO|nr:helix-turn-helix domain-containing protein [Seonamhaeicola marinus]TYA92192.1 AraC family transcriptional regulator [Seonamhaeicola marinus]
MENVIPKVTYKQHQSLHIEVMNFQELSEKLENTKDHNPYNLHRIEFFLILILNEGSYTHFVDFAPFELKSGSALFVAKNQVHFFSRKIKDVNGYCIVFNTTFREKFHFSFDSIKLNRLFNYHIETPIIHQENLLKDSFIAVAQQLYNEYKSPNTFVKTEMLRALLQVLFLKAERAKESQSTTGIKPYWLDTFNSFKNQLEDHYRESRSSRYYSSKINISYKFLNDVVKKISGKTAKAFIDDFVIMEIKRLLVSTALSIKEISYQTGFEEPSNMVKFFKKHTKITPLKLRQQL